MHFCSSCWEMRLAILNPHNRFLLSLLISAVIHLGVVAYLNPERTRRIFEKPIKTIEVTYQAVKQKRVDEEKQVKVMKIVQRKLEEPKKIKILDKHLPSFMPEGKNIKDMSKLSDDLSFNKKITPKIETHDLNRKITVPLLKSEKITNPKYLSYNETIRQKIRQRAYAYIDNPDFQSGEVYLSFIVDSTGTLKGINLNEQKSYANDYLKQVGERSIRESNPFPPFPTDLNYPELTFNVLISFEVGQ